MKINYFSLNCKICLLNYDSINTKQVLFTKNLLKSNSYQTPRALLFFTFTYTVEKVLRVNHVPHPYYSSPDL